MERITPLLQIMSENYTLSDRLWHLMEISDLKWCRFKFKCKRHLRKMRPDDMDRDKMMELIDTCKTWYDVDELVKAYNETYFGELIQTLRDDDAERSHDGSGR